MKIMLKAIYILSLIAFAHSVNISIGHVYLYASEIPVIQMAFKDLDNQGILPAVYDIK